MPQPQRHGDDAVASDATRPAPTAGEPVLFDGGDLACGELLLTLLGVLDGVVDGTEIRVVATDPAAPIDIPSWCYLTGHTYLRSGTHTDGRAAYHLRYSEVARRTRPGRPWHLADAAPDVPHNSASQAPEGTSTS